MTDDSTGVAGVDAREAAEAAFNGPQSSCSLPTTPLASIERRAPTFAAPAAEGGRRESSVGGGSVGGGSVGDASVGDASVGGGH